MSRVGKMPIPLPKGVEISIKGSEVTVKGPQGELSRSFDPALSISVNDDNITVSRPSDNRIHRSLHGLTRSLLANMVEGVSKGFNKVMPGVKDARAARKRRHMRVRKKVRGTAERPRLCVFRSLNHVYAQVVDDNLGHTLVSASTLEREVRSDVEGKVKAEAAQLVGKLVAERAVKKGITKVVFDRGGYKYHGRVKVLAETARKVGLVF